jgi:hypothetical protein
MIGAGLKIRIKGQKTTRLKSLNLPGNGRDRIHGKRFATVDIN